MRREDQPSPEGPKKPGNNVPWFAWVAAVLVGGFIVLAIIGSLLPDPPEEEQDTPSAGTSAVPIATTTSTPPPTPVRRATPPTPVTRYQITPTPAPAVSAICERPAEAAYLASVVEHLDSIGSSAFGDLMGEMGDNPTLFVDDDWRLQTALQLALLQISANGLLDLAAPPSLQSLDAIVKEAAGLVESATMLYAQGLDDFDPDAVDKANALVVEATPLISDIPVESARLCGR